MSALERFKVHGLTVEMWHDEYPESPRDWCNLGTMVCSHHRYILGDFEFTGQGKRAWEFYRDDFPNRRTLARYLGIVVGAAVVLPLALYEHSGITMFVGSRGGYPFDSAGWDTSDVGFIYVTREQVQKEYGNLSAESLAKAEACLRAEVETYDQYLTGAVYGFTVEDTHGVLLDSCGGFFGWEYACEEAKQAASRCAEEMSADLGVPLPD